RIERRVGDEDIRRLDHPVKHGAALDAPEIEREPTLRPVVDDPAEVDGALRYAGTAHAMAIRIAVRRLDLDHVGPEVRHHGRGHAAGDEVRRVDDAQALEHHPAASNRPRTATSGTVSSVRTAARIDSARAAGSTRLAQSRNFTSSSPTVSGFFGWPFACDTRFCSRRPSASV